MTTSELLAAFEEQESSEAGFGLLTLANTSQSSAPAWVLDQPDFYEALVNDITFKRKFEELRPALQTDSEPGHSTLMLAAELLVEAEEAVHTAGQWVRDRFSLRLPQLSHMLRDDVVYAKTVLSIGWSLAPLAKDLAAFLLPQQVLLVATASDRRLEEVTNKASHQVLELGRLRDTLSSFVEARMSQLAPNVTALVGSSVAAKLIAEAGGLGELAKLTGNALCALGTKQKRVALAGFSLSQAHRSGCLWECQIIQSTQAEHRAVAARLVSGRCSLAARIDMDRSTNADEQPAGSAVPERCQGALWYDEIVAKLEQKGQPQQAVSVKPHKPPDLKKKRNTRGGRQARAHKKKFAMTHERKLQNRVFFKGDS